jgi:hypothetical protein
MKPYTYLIGWKEQTKFYYGVRYAIGCDPSEFLITYFTSSVEVEKMITTHGLPDIVQIRKTFNDVGKARFWEHKVLRRMKVVKSEKWLNQTDNKSIAPRIGKLNHMFGKFGEMSHRYGTTLPEESKKIIGEKSRLKKGNMPEGFSEKMREIVTGRKQKESTKKKISDELSGRTISSKHKKNISLNHADVFGKNNPFFGKNHTAEQRKLMSEQRTGTVMINKDGVIKRIHKDVLEGYLQQGWIRGKGKKKWD